MEHLIHLYYGEGKGKTTAAMGLALRALGHGRRVLVAQFLKKNNSGELSALARFPTARLVLGPAVSGFWSRADEAARAHIAAEQTAYLDELTRVVAGFEPELTVLDELAHAQAVGAVAFPAVEALVRAAQRTGEVALTGRRATEPVLQLCDYITKLHKERHPFDRGIAARKGVEW